MANISRNKHKNLLTISVLAIVLTLTPQYAFAQLTPVEDMATSVQAFLTGTFARSAAAIAIAVIGYRWFSGRMELGRALTICAGIVLILGAPAIVGWIDGAV